MASMSRVRQTDIQASAVSCRLETSPERRINRASALAMGNVPRVAGFFGGLQFLLLLRFCIPIISLGAKLV
jgi:hypothetical protein